MKTTTRRTTAAIASALFAFGLAACEAEVDDGAVEEGVEDIEGEVGEGEGD